MSSQEHVVSIASLLASRLCHDLVNPVGALNTGLEVLAEDSDPEMREHALNLIRESADKTIAVLTFTRLAFGASGGFDGELDMADVKTATEGYYAHVKAELDWALPASPMQKTRARAVMNLLMIAEKSAPRAGSMVRVEEIGGDIVIRAMGPKTKLSDEVVTSVAGNIDNLQAKETPAYLAQLLAEFGGDQISVEAVSEQEVLFRISAISQANSATAA